jgi:phospholipid/cholesterol/gamma-HCH transport system substrate-binding protein
MNEPVNKRATVVGIFILLGILLLIGSILTIGNLHSTFSRKMTISTLFSDVNGLHEGNNIWFSGVKIGTVKKLELYGKSKVRVVMNINVESQQYIRKDATVKMSTDGLIGNKILVIDGGSSMVPEIEEGDTLLNETILSTEDMMKTLQQNNLNILVLTQKLAKGEGTIGKLLQSDSMYYKLYATIHSVETASAKAQAILASLATFIEKTNKKGTLANDLVTDTVVFYSLKRSLLKMQNIADTATLFVENLKKASANTKSPLGVLLHDEQSANSLKTTISNLESSSAKLDQNLEALQHSFLLKKYFKKRGK